VEFIEEMRNWSLRIGFGPAKKAIDLQQFFYGDRAASPPAMTAKREEAVAGEELKGLRLRRGARGDAAIPL
jgi:hypothetical protein